MTTKGPVPIAPADGKLGVLLPGHRRSQHDIHRGRRGGQARARRADWIADAARDGAARQTHRGTHAADQGFRAAGEAGGSRIRRLGHLRGQRLRSGAERRGARSSAPGAGARAAGKTSSDGCGFRSGLRAQHPRAESERSAHQDGQGRDADGRHPAIPEAHGRRAHRDGLVRIDRGVPSAGGGA